jgi:hypothetical protein
MEDQTRKPRVSTFETSSDGKFDLDALLHPARAFSHRMDVVRDPEYLRSSVECSGIKFFQF